jgi:branched-chain amino acid transport system substrate-binding protein
MTQSVLRRGATLLLVATLLLAAAACSADGKKGGGGSSSGSSGSGSSSGTYDAVGIVSLTGGFATIGQAAKVAVTAAVAVINANGGIDGKQMTVSFKDDTGQAPEAAAIAQGLMNGGKPPAMLAPASLTSGVAAAILSAVNTKHVLSTGAAISPTLNAFPYYIGGSAQSGDSVNALLTKIAKSGVKTFGLITTDDDTGKATIGLLGDSASKYGLQVVDSERIAPDAVDAVPLLQRIKAKNPDVLVAAMSGPTVPVVIKSRAKVGWTIPMWADPSFASTPFYDGLDPSMFKGIQMVVPQTYVDGSDFSKTKAFTTMMAALLKVQGGPLPATSGNYLGFYMAVMLAKYAADAAHSTDAAAIYAARLKLNVKDMPLYGGSSLLWSTQGSHWALYSPEDYVAITPGGTRNGFLIPGR